MSGLVDMWTTELSKLKEKEGQTIPSGGSSPIQHETSRGSQEKDNGSTRLAVAVGKFMQFHKPMVLYSEASVSMLVEWFSP